MCTYVYIIMLYVCFYVGEHLVQALPFVLPLHFVINLIIIIIIIKSAYGPATDMLFVILLQLLLLI